MSDRLPDRAGASPVAVLAGPMLAGPMVAGPVLAHQGGWDEILLVLAPLLVIALLLWVANRRANKRIGPPPEA